MRIKLSIVIPVGFIGFCGVFMLLLVNAERAKREQEEEARQARKMYVLIRKEQRSLRKIFFTMLGALEGGRIEDALSLYADAKRSMDAVDSFIGNIPAREWRMEERRKADVLGKKMEVLHAALSRGDSERALEVLKNIVGGKKRGSDDG